MKNTIKIINENEVLVTKDFQKKATLFGTEEYKLWKNVLSDFPSAKMTTKKITKNPNKRTYKNLTYVRIEKFLMTQDNSEELLKEYSTAREQAVIQTNPYRAVLAWFLQKYPNYDDYKGFFETDKKEHNEKQNNDEIYNNNISNFEDAKAASNM